MTFFSLIRKNVLRSPRMYVSYFVNSLLAVLVFYIFSILRFHPSLNGDLGGSSQLVSNFAVIGVQASQFLVILLAFLFLGYSFQSFMQKRRYDISVYQMLGMKPKDIRKILFGENMLIGVSAIIVGLFIGTIFTKFFLLFIAKILSTSELSFYFPSQALFLTILSFLGVYLLISFLMTLKIEGIEAKITKPKNKLSQKVNYWGAISSLVCLIVGYSSVFIFLETIQYAWLLVCIILTIIGTFYFFKSIYPLILQWQKQRALPNGLKFLTYSDSLYKGKETVSLFVVLVCSPAIALVGIGVTQVLGGNEFSTKESGIAAYTFGPVYSDNFNEQDPEIQVVTEQVNQWIEEAGYQPKVYQIPTVMVSYKLSPEDDYGMSVPVIRVSDYQKIMSRFDLPQINPKANEIYVMNPTQPEEQSTKTPIYSLFGNDKESGVLIPKEVSVRLASFEEGTQVATDDFVFKAIANQKQTGSVYSVYTLLDFDEWSVNPALNQRIQAYLNDFALQENQSFNYISKYEEKMTKKRSNTYILLLAILLASVFFVFTGSILSFKVFSNLDKEAKEQHILSQIGLKPKERRQMITSQLLHMYFLPAIISCLHFSVAFIALKLAVNLPIWHYYWQILGSYLLFQTILFGLTRLVYLKKLEQAIAENLT